MGGFLPVRAVAAFATCSGPFAHGYSDQREMRPIAEIARSPILAALFSLLVRKLALETLMFRLKPSKVGET